MTTQIDEEKTKKILLECVLKRDYKFIYVPHSAQDNKTCSICLDSIKGKPIFVLHCAHTFCVDCTVEPILTFKQRKCPECKKPFVARHQKKLH